jgi:hypothetical protein
MKNGDSSNYAVQFTAMDFASVAAALDVAMNEERAHRMFIGFGRAIKKGDPAIDVAWALAKMLNNLISEQPDDEQTDLLRTFISMVLLVQIRSEQRVQH